MALRGRESGAETQRPRNGRHCGELGLQIKMNSVSISPDLISQIEKLCNEYSGGCPLYLKIQDDKEKINLELLSRKFRVKPINEMVVKFRKIKDVAIEVVA